MDGYVFSIVQAIIIFPVIALVFTIPYALVQYHKYGSIPLLRVGVVYSFILYLITAYFIVILPLPPIEEVSHYTTPTMQLVPFDFVRCIIKNTQVIWSNPSTYLQIFREPDFYQAAFNFLLLVPFGIYLKYYFNCSFKKTLLYSFLLSLFFEITQLSGLYGIYPRGYRMFDVDDLMINTLGGIFGFAVALLVLKVLPNRKKIDDYAYKKGQNVTVWKRFFTFFLDACLFVVISIVPLLLFQKIDFRIILGILVFFYFILIPCVTKGKTFGKMFLNMRLVTFKEKTPHIYQYIIRYALLFGVALPLPLYFFLLGNYLTSLDFALVNDTMFKTVLTFFLIGFAFIYYFLSFIAMLKGNPLWYEALSRTKNKSTIELKETEE